MEVIEAMMGESSGAFRLQCECPGLKENRGELRGWVGRLAGLLQVKGRESRHTGQCIGMRLSDGF